MVEYPTAFQIQFSGMFVHDPVECNSWFGITTLMTFVIFLGVQDGIEDD